jgi:hypothetical protein
MVVRPTITYAATIWWPGLKYTTRQAKPSKLQRLAFVRVRAAIRTATSAAAGGPSGPLSPLFHSKIEAEAGPEFTDSIATRSGDPNNYGTGKQANIGTLRTNQSYKWGLIKRYRHMHFVNHSRSGYLLEVNGTGTQNPLEKGTPSGV